MLLVAADACVCGHSGPFMHFADAGVFARRYDANSGRAAVTHSWEACDDDDGRRSAANKNHRVPVPVPGTKQLH